MNVVSSLSQNQMSGNLTAQNADKDWWRGAVIYQIYPRSYQDSNGDGIGDLKGITSRLPHIASLGADAIWISPFFTSPMLDFGYDVSDYRSVDPMFGTLADFDELIATAHDLGLKVMIDQVLSHTSDQHEWFKESRSSRDNAKADWYVWADPKPDGTPPNNWLSIFGGSSWEWETTRRQYYLHNFLTSQPDLNFHCMDVQDALLDAVRFWLDRGVDGFRLDTINFFFHSKGLENNPALSADRMNATIAPDVNPYNFQDHLYDKNQPENLEFLKRFRALLDEYPAAAAVGEVGDAQYGLQIVADYTSGDDMMHMCYSFDFLDSTALSAGRVQDVVQTFERVATEGWSCWAFSNHDVMRHASRWAEAAQGNADFFKLVPGIIGTLRGSVCLYQGEELGLTEVDIAYEDLQDPYGIRFWPKFKGRDGCRTPMVWDRNDAQGGFTAGKPWLPVAPEHVIKAVSAQEADASSLMCHYRHFFNFRKTQKALIKGDITFLSADNGVLAFTREFENERLLCVFNFNNAVITYAVPMGMTLVPLDSGYGGAVAGGVVTLNAFDGLIGNA